MPPTAARALEPGAEAVSRRAIGISTGMDAADRTSLAAYQLPLVTQANDRYLMHSKAATRNQAAHTAPPISATHQHNAGQSPPPSPLRPRHPTIGDRRDADDACA